VVVAVVVVVVVLVVVVVVVVVAALYNKFSVQINTPSQTNPSHAKPNSTLCMNYRSSCWFV